MVDDLKRKYKPIVHTLNQGVFFCFDRFIRAWSIDTKKNTQLTFHTSCYFKKKRLTCKVYSIDT